MTALTGSTLAGNRPARALLDRLGFRVRSLSGGVLEVELAIARAVTPACASYRGARRTSGSSSRELRRAGEDARQVTLDGPHGHEQRLSDLAVGEAVARQLGHAPLAGRERLDPAQGHPARLGAGGP